MLLTFDNESLPVRPAGPGEFTAHHEDQVAAMLYTDGALRFTDPRWRARYLGRGEEKACFCVRDGEGRVFVLELIDERTYRNGRYVGGVYFGQWHVAGVTGVPFDPDAGPFALRFTGLVKAREFAYGHEWARFQWRADRPTRLDPALTALLRLVFAGRFERYRRRHADVHERNVLFEIRPWRAGGVPVLTRDATGRLRLGRVRLAPVDLRSR